MPQQFPEIADGVLRMGTELINWYLVVEDDRVILVEAGAPRYHSRLERGLAQLGRGFDDVRAVVLTHADADHKSLPRSSARSRAFLSMSTQPTRS